MAEYDTDRKGSISFSAVDDESCEKVTFERTLVLSGHRTVIIFVIFVSSSKFLYSCKKIVRIF